MLYQREFNLQISHFNNAYAYTLYEEAYWNKDTKDTTAAHTLQHVVNKLLECLKLTHGHNLRIVIELSGQPPKPSTIEGDASWIGVGYLVDDSELEKLVMEWDNTNLSVLPEFFGSGKRATTEEMTNRLCAKISERWTHLDSIRVSIWETPLIMAQAEIKY